MNDGHDITPYLDRALDLEPPERDTWLTELDTLQPDIARKVRALLARHARLDAEGFLAQSPVDPATRTHGAGTRVGAYTLERMLGRGGMGEVWLATRSDGRFEGRCAIKFLDDSLVSARLAERFRREGSILARLAHPHIARLLDAGATDDGRPYLALEYVDGERIDRFCRTAGLSIERRVRLFVDVVGAVAHAHSHLVIHRDLKPSNVLVTRDGHVKLLDFGIAKLLATEAGDTELTRVEDAALTPEYAAPEQMLGEAPSTATDVYQLGMLLHVLLTGRHPAAHAGTRAEKIRAALDTVVPRASDVAAGADRARLRGDLDAILDLALRRNPAERYPTAQALEDDLRRFLDREPVVARRGAALYRARKFVGRHLLATVGSTVALAGLVIALLFALGQAREAARQRDTTRRELARATAVNDFATYLVSAASPGDGRFTASELLAESESLIDKQFPADDPIKAEILAMVGAQYIVAQRFDKAGPILDRAAQIAAPIGDPALNARANCPRALVMMVLRGQHREADALMRRSLAELPTAEEYGQLRAECLTRYSEFGYINSEAEPMIRHATEALALFDANPDASLPRRIDAQSALAWGYYLAHENEKADREFDRIARALAAVGRDRTLAAADNFNNWSMVHYRGDLRRAEPLMRRALELRRYIEGTGVAPSFTFNQAGILLLLGRFGEAIPLYEETLRTAEARGEDDMLANAIMEFADLRIQTGNLGAAQDLLDRARVIVAERRVARNRRAILAYHLGLLAEARGDARAARARYLESAGLFQPGDEKIGINVSLLCAIARVERILGNLAASARAAEEAVSLAQVLAEPHSPSYWVGKAWLATGDTRRAAGKADESRRAFGVARENLEQTLGAGHPLTIEAARKSAL